MLPPNKVKYTVDATYFVARGGEEILERRAGKGDHAAMAAAFYQPFRKAARALSIELHSYFQLPKNVQRFIKRFQAFFHLDSLSQFPYEPSR